MPRDKSIESVLVIGSGPIVIGQACEFDYSGTQACRVLKEEGYRVILANSNPATIMTDPDFADRTYIEPLTPEVLEAIIEREKPDAVLPTLGGQTALNLAMALFEKGVVGVPGKPELIGANAEAIATAEDREKFKIAMLEIGLKVPQSGVARSIDEAEVVRQEIGLPLIVRPAYITRTLLQIPATTPRSWVISTIAMPKRFCRSASRSRICAWIVTSSAVVGSSAMSTSGSLAIAMAIMTRWRIPPEYSCGYCPARSPGSGIPTTSSSSITRPLRSDSDAPF